MARIILFILTFGWFFFFFNLSLRLFFFSIIIIATVITITILIGVCAVEPVCRWVDGRVLAYIHSKKKEEAASKNISTYKYISWNALLLIFNMQLSFYLLQMAMESMFFVYNFFTYLSLSLLYRWTNFFKKENRSLAHMYITKYTGWCWYFSAAMLQQMSSLLFLFVITMSTFLSFRFLRLCMPEMFEREKRRLWISLVVLFTATISLDFVSSFIVKNYCWRVPISEWKQKEQERMLFFFFSFSEHLYIHIFFSTSIFLPFIPYALNQKKKNGKRQPSISIQVYTSIHMCGCTPLS